jgi:hypothetical protein
MTRKCSTDFAVAFFQNMKMTNYLLPKRRFVTKTLPIRPEMLAEITLEGWERNNGRIVIEDSKTDNAKFNLFALYPSSPPPKKKDTGFSSFLKNTVTILVCWSDFGRRGP